METIKPSVNLVCCDVIAWSRVLTMLKEGEEVGGG